MDVMHVTAGPDDDGRRLDSIIRRFLRETSLSQVYGAVRKGLIKVDGKKCTPETRVRAGSDIAIASFLVRENNPQISEPLPDDLVLFRNDDVLMVNKPYDLSVQKARRGDVSLADMVAADYAAWQKKTASLSFRPGPLHRLDRKTTGIIVFSQSLRGAQWFSRALQTHAVHKTYLALLQGKLESTVTWEDFIAEEEKSTDYTDGTDGFHTVTVIGASPTMTDDCGKYAHTVASPLAYGSYQGSPVTLARVEIGTGRKHQIRAQAAAHGFPLLGDTAYGGRAIRAAQDFFLHAYRLAIGENPLGAPTEITADISTNFAKMLSICLINFDARL